jgi:two-component system, LytTR family, sensor kinase
MFAPGLHAPTLRLMAADPYRPAALSATASNGVRQVTGPPMAKALRFWLVVLAIWSLLALLSVSQTALYLGQHAIPIHWQTLAVGRLANWYTCALFLPLLFWLARRHPVERTSWARTVPLALVVCFGCAVAKSVIYLPVDRYLGEPDVTLKGLLTVDTLSEFTTFGYVLGIIYAVEFYRRYQMRQADTTRLESELTRARLDALVAQLRPHFLFNTMGAIGELVHQDPAAADRMLTMLSDLLRETLRRPGDTDIPLPDEMALVARYVEIMRVRYGNRLTVEVHVAPQSLEAIVPAFLLQPLVENAFEHGIARRPGPGCVKITTSVVRGGGSERTLMLGVEDDGLGLDSSSVADGLGIATTRQRLLRRFGDRQRLHLEPRPGGGTRATIGIPFVTGRNAPLRAEATDDDHLQAAPLQ